MTTERFARHNLKILVVEDDIGHSESILRTFHQELPDADVVLTRTIRDALKSVAEATPDIAIVDFLLLDGCGVELLPAKAEQVHYPIIILTAHGDEREAVDSLKAGALNYLVKSETVFTNIVNIVDMALREWQQRQEGLQVEGALRESEERFRNLIEGSIQGIFIERDWKVLFANQAFANILGYDSPDEVLALPSSEVLTVPGERDRIRAYYELRLAGENAPTHYEYEGLRKDGSSVALQNVVRLVSWDGQPAAQSVVVDVSDRKRAEIALQHQAALEEMTTNISARFINLTSFEIDDGIAHALRDIGEFSEVDRASVVIFSENYTQVTLAFEWCSPGVPSLRDGLQNAPADTIPWMAERHRKSQLVYASRLANLPPEADLERSRLLQQRTKSLISIPLISKGKVIGFFILDSVREEKRWTEDAISILTIVGESFANALDRQEAEETLRASEQRFRDFADIAADWFWEMDADLRFTALSERYQEILGVEPETHIGLSVQEIFSGRVGDQEVWRSYLENLHEKKPINVELVWVRNDGGSRMVRHIGRPRFSQEGEFLGYRGVGRDVTVAHQMTAHIEHQASHDALTGLVNRREFERRLGRAVTHAKDHGAQYVLGYIDLDQFKIVNDIAGHAAGDELLKRVSAVLNAKIRGRDTLARLGGDEFSLLLENCPLEKALEISDSMLNDVREFRFSWEGRSFEIGLSVGLISVNVHAESASRELAKADLACYTAKRLGKNRVHVYRMGAIELTRRQSDVTRISDLRDALANDQFLLYSQPIMSLTCLHGVPTHYELLIRMLDDAGGIVMPDVFIPAAERYGLMVPIDRWVIRTAFRDSNVWLSTQTDTSLVINLSGNSLNDDSFADFVVQEFEASGMPTRQVCFEITETAAINSFDRASGFITRLRKMGCQFALDDFGSGVSSFTYLKHLPVDFLKIDGGFVRDMADEPVDRVMVAAIHEVGRIMGIRTIAECADTCGAIEQLRSLGVDYVQGDAVGMAVPLSDLLDRTDT